MKTNWPDEEIDRVLAERDPRPEAVAPFGSALGPDAGALLNSILAVDPATAPSVLRGDADRHVAFFGRQHARRPPRRLGIRIAVASLAAVMAAAVGVGLSSGPRLPPPNGQGHSVGTAADALRQVALVADVQPALPALRPDQFVYTKEIDVDLSTAVNDTVTYATIHEITRQNWLAPDGAGRIAEANIKQWFLTPADRTKWVEAGSLSFSSQFPLVNQSGGPGWFRFTELAELAKLSTEPKALAQEMQVGKIDHPPLTVFEKIGDLLGWTDAPPALRSALYRVAAGLPGVKLLGPVTDSVGRRGTAVAYDGSGETTELIFDPTTSALLENETIVTDGAKLTGATDRTPVPAPADTPTGTVVESATYLARGIVDSKTARPPSTGGDGR